jgi:hypothetical protein
MDELEIRTHQVSGCTFDLTGRCVAGDRAFVKACVLLMGFTEPGSSRHSDPQLLGIGTHGVVW